MKVFNKDLAWNETEHLLAHIIDCLNVANWQRANAGLKKAKQSPEPKPIPRPSNVQQAKEKISDIGKRLKEQKERLRGK